MAGLRLRHRKRLSREAAPRSDVISIEDILCEVTDISLYRYTIILYNPYMSIICCNSHIITKLISFHCYNTLLGKYYLVDLLRKFKS